MKDVIIKTYKIVSPSKLKKDIMFEVGAALDKCFESAGYIGIEVKDKWITIRKEGVKDGKVHKGC